MGAIAMLPFTPEGSVSAYLDHRHAAYSVPHYPLPQILHPAAADIASGETFRTDRFSNLVVQSIQSTKTVDYELKDLPSKALWLPRRQKRSIYITVFW